MYNRVHSYQYKCFMLKSYTTGMNTSILLRKHYEDTFSEKLVNELHYWIENHPHVIHLPNVSDSLLIKINGTLVKKKKYLLQISVRELHNDTIRPIYEGVFWVQEQLMENYVLEIRNLGSTFQNI